MANRNDSDTRQHETLPGPGPGPNAPKAGGARPVEQMVDAAIDRIAREQDGSFELARRHGGQPPVGHLARRDFDQTPPRIPTRLRWKGLDVSEEFRQYAERVARGEDLPPFEGRVLAEPNPAFPWGSGVQPEEPPKKRGSHPVMWSAAIAVLGLLGWSLVSQSRSGAPDVPFATSVAPLSPTSAQSATVGSPGANAAFTSTTAEPAAPSSATPHDVVETPTLAATAAADPEPPSVTADPTAAPQATAAPMSSPAPASSPSLGAPRPAASAPNPPPAGTPGVAVNLARPGALQQAVGAALAAHDRGTTSSSEPVAASGASGKAAREEDDPFGIMAPVGSAPVTPAPSGAKSNGNVGDLARAGQPPASAVRKEPGGESSAKESLLVDTPSF